MSNGAIRRFITDKAHSAFGPNLREAANAKLHMNIFKLPEAKVSDRKTDAPEVPKRPEPLSMNASSLVSQERSVAPRFTIPDDRYESIKAGQKGFAGESDIFRHPDDRNKDAIQAF